MLDKRVILEIHELRDPGVVLVVSDGLLASVLCRA